MAYVLNLGTLDVPPPSAGTGGKFRMALLGDFSGRANRGECAIGDELAARRPIRLDIDTIDDVIASFGATLNLTPGSDDAVMPVPLANLDDLHPDALYGSLDLFADLRGLRQKLGNPKTAQAAAQQVRAWSQTAAPPKKARGRSRASAVRTDAKLSDFRKLLDAPVTERPESGVDALVRSAVAPWVSAAPPGDAGRLVAAVDAAVGATMKNILHHPDFQALETAWRTLDFIVRRVETGARLEVVLYDVSADELAADLASVEDLQDSGLYRMLVEAPAADARQGALSLLIGNYVFEMTPPHAELLGRMARVAAQARVPFIAALGADSMNTADKDLHPMVADAWSALRALPEAAYLALATPRFLLRTPYGRKTDPVEAFEFEEFGRDTGLAGLVWGNGAILAGVLIAEHMRRHGPGVPLGKIMSLPDMPYFFFTDDDGEQVALPCTERLLTERKAMAVAARGCIGLLAMKGRPEVRLSGFVSVAGAALAGPWSGADAKAAAPDHAAAPAKAAADAGEQADMGASAVDAPADAGGDLDALLAQLNGGGDTAPAADAAGAGDSGDLDKLLAELNQGAAAADSPAGAEDELDRLLKELK